MMCCAAAMAAERDSLALMNIGMSKITLTKNPFGAVNLETISLLREKAAQNTKNLCSLSKNGTRMNINLQGLM